MIDQACGITEENYRAHDALLAALLAERAKSAPVALAATLALLKAHGVETE